MQSGSWASPVQKSKKKPIHVYISIGHVVDDKILWDNTDESSQQRCLLNFPASDTIESKSFLLDIDRYHILSLQASFLNGPIEVGGSAKYLNDKKKWKEFKNRLNTTNRTSDTSRHCRCSSSVRGEKMTLNNTQIVGDYTHTHLWHLFYMYCNIPNQLFFINANCISQGLIDLFVLFRYCAKKCHGLVNKVLLHIYVLVSLHL